jgi:PAS domain S-box-containing protein
MNNSPYTVLIISSNSVDRAKYQQYLLADSNWTYHCLETTSVASAVELCRGAGTMALPASRIDAIVLDYLLSDGSGLDFLAALRDQNDGSSPAVVTMMNEDNSGIVSNAINFGTEVYCSKRHLTPEGLQQAIRQTIAASCLQRQLDHDRFFNVSLDLMAVANFEGYFLRLNPAWEAALGFTNAELMAQPYIDLVHPDDRNATQSAAQGLSQGTSTIQFENRYRAKDGSYRWLLWSASPYDEQNLVYAVAHDITDRKCDEERLRQSEELTRRILESSPDCIKVLDLRGRLIYMNNSGQSLMEIDDFDTVANSQWLEFWQDNENELEQVSAQTAFSAALAGGVQRFDGYCLTAKGTPKWWEVVVTPILDANGDVYQILSVSRDITARKRQEAALLQSERKFSAIFNQTFQLMGLVSLDGVLLDVNQAALDSIAALKSEIVGKHFWDTPWWHTEPLQQQLKAAVASAANGQFVRYEVEFLNSNGAVMITDFSLKPMFDAVGCVEAIVAEANDITDRKQVQSVLEAQNRELDNFAHIVSHDLKAPLRAIANLSQWIEEDLEGMSLSDTQSQMALLRNRVERMAATIDGLLDYARIGRTNDSVELVSVTELLAEVIDSLAPPLTFTIAIEPPLPMLKTNRLLLSQVFANLISNSIKHHDRLDGKVHIACQECGDSYRFVVADDGPGIDARYHDKIFQIFQAGSQKVSPDSTGIGLSIVKKVIETAGGTIHLQSTIGQGAKFYFTWPKQ